MKKYFFLFILAFSLGFTQAQNDGKIFSGLDKSPLDVVITRNADNNAIARVIYSRPAKRDREVFGNLVPYGQVWRTGANEATEITFYKDVSFDDKLIKAGTYSIYTIPNKENWTFILNSSTTQWGTEYDASKNILELAVEPMSAPSTIENFSISFIDQDQGVIMFLGWDETIVQVPIKVAG